MFTCCQENNTSLMVVAEREILAQQVGKQYSVSAIKTSQAFNARSQLNGLLTTPTAAQIHISSVTTR